jgi:hypothetical protein
MDRQIKSLTTSESTLRRLWSIHRPGLSLSHPSVTVDVGHPRRIRWSAPVWSGCGVDRLAARLTWP